MWKMSNKTLFYQFNHIILTLRRWEQFSKQYLVKLVSALTSFFNVFSHQELRRVAARSASPPQHGGADPRSAAAGAVDGQLHWTAALHPARSPSAAALEAGPGGRRWLSHLSDLQCVYVYYYYWDFICFFRSVGLWDISHSDSLWGSHDSPGGSHHVHLSAVCLLSNKGWLPHINLQYWPRYKTIHCK